MTVDFTPFWVSFQLGVWVTGLLLLLGFPLSWAFARARGAWVSWVEPIFALPLVLPPTVLGFYLLVFLSPQGPVGDFLEKAFGLRLVFSFGGMVLASAVSGLPFMLSALRQGWNSLDPHLWEASFTLGKGRAETLFRVILPNLRFALLAGVIMTFAHTVGEFGVVLMIGGSLPGVTKVVSVAIYERVETLDFATAHIYALILVIASYAGVVLMNRLQRRERGRQ